MKLNLEAKNDAEKKLLEYLENNASEALAEKINNGTPYEKNGKNLINKKDLESFLSYANDEARKLAEKGKNYACIEDQTVFDWAIHYFEEDTIVGNLYNEDGTKYEPPKKTTTTKTTCPLNKPLPPKPKEPTLFDLLSTETPKKQEKPKEEKPKAIEIKEEKPEQVVVQNNKKIDLETGEVLEEYQSIDKHSMLILYDILNGELEVQ